MWHIITYEYRQFKADKRFAIVTGLIFILTAFSLYQGTLRTDQAQEIRNDRIAAQQEFYEQKHQELIRINQGEDEPEQWWRHPGHPLALGTFRGSGKFVFPESRALSVIAAGHSDILPDYGRVRLHLTEAVNNHALENPVLKAAGHFDYAFFLVWLIPLFVIALSYNMISAEKERGTYTLLRSMPVTSGQIIRAKVMFRFLLIAIVIIAAAGASFLILGIRAQLPDLLMLLAAILSYLVFWFAVCLLVNLIDLGSAANALSLGGIWILFLLVVPAFINTLASSMYPVPSRAEWIVEQRAIQQQIEADADDILDRFYSEHPGEVPQGELPLYYEYWNTLFITAAVVHEKEQEALTAFKKPQRRQEKLIAALRFLSPPVWLQSRLERLAGTDAQTLRGLHDNMHTFHQEWKAFFIPIFRELRFVEASEFQSIPEP